MKTPAIESAEFYRNLPTGSERGVEAIKYCHRLVRLNMFDATQGDLEALARVEVALDILTIIRPGMSREQVLLAAARRLVEADETG